MASRSTVAKLPSATTIRSRPGASASSQRASWPSICRAQSVSVFARRPPGAPAARSASTAPRPGCGALGASAVKTGSAHTRWAHGIGTSSMTESQRRALTVMVCEREERTGSR